MRVSYSNSSSCHSQSIKIFSTCPALPHDGCLGALWHNPLSKVRALSSCSSFLFFSLMFWSSLRATMFLVTIARRGSLSARKAVARFLFHAVGIQSWAFLHSSISRTFSVPVFFLSSFLFYFLIYLFLTRYEFSWLSLPRFSRYHLKYL